MAICQDRDVQWFQFVCVDVSVITSIMQAPSENRTWTQDWWYSLVHDKQRNEYGQIRAKFAVIEMVLQSFRGGEPAILGAECRKVCPDAIQIGKL